VPLVSGDKHPIFLIPDNTPMAALGCIDKLDWLIVPGVPVAITDQVADEATRNTDLPWTAGTHEWIVRNVVQGRVSIAYTDTGFDYRQQFDSWARDDMPPERHPRSKHLGEASILELMVRLEERARGKNKAIVLVDERRARKALGTLDANLDIVSTRAFFEVMATDYRINDALDLWPEVLARIGSMDTLNEIHKVRIRGED
jgi:hypothetical protein